MLAHEWPDVVAHHRRVLEDRLHLGEVGTELGGDADVAFDHAEQRAVDNCSDDLLLRHGPFLAGWRVTFAFPLTFPHLDHFHMTSKAGRVLFRVSQKHRHRLTGFVSSGSAWHFGQPCQKHP